MNNLKLWSFLLVIILIFALCCGCTPGPTEPATTPTQPTQPSAPAPLTVVWEMKAYVCHPTGTTTDFFTIRLNSTILEEADDTYLQLNLDLPENFRFQPAALSDEKGALGIDGDAGLYIARSVFYDRHTEAPAECIWAIDTEKKYFIAYWGDEFGQFLVATADPKANYDDVLRHFRDFIYTHCDNDPAITTWDLDWTLYGMWIGGDGQVTENIEFTLTGLVVYHPNLLNHSLADIEIRWPDGYRFYSPLQMNGVRVNEQYPEGLYIDGGIAADDRNTQKIVIGDYGLAPELGLFWLHWEGTDYSYEIPGYLIASTDPNTPRGDIEAFFAHMMASEGFQ